MKKDYKAKILEIVSKKELYSIMNSTKWRELKQSVSEMPFYPPFVIKNIMEDLAEYHCFDKDVSHLGDWGMNLDGYLGGDIGATPYYAIEWVKVRPRYMIYQGRLMPHKLIDATDQFVAILNMRNIPYEYEDGTFIIYGYKSSQN